MNTAGPSPRRSTYAVQGCLRAAALITLGLWVLACAAAPDPAQEREDNRLLSLALSRPESDGRFEVVFPDTDLQIQDRSGAAMDALRDRIRGFANREGFDASRLLDRLLERNKRSRRLTLMSSEAYGYFVDYEKKYFPYFQGSEGDWRRMYAAHPKVTGVKHVSLPAHDPASMTVLIYVCRQTMPASGSGAIYMYRDTGSSLQELGRVQTWVP
jgi:hypothetical protein